MLADKMRAILGVLRSPQPLVVAIPAVDEDWLTAILGAELCGNPAIVSDRQKLLKDLFAGGPAATLLVGLLMVFRTLPSEKLPMVLKDIGEAYYRWQSLNANGPGPLEAFLAEWLSESCRKARVPCRIGLVHTGERFDSARHYASTPGVEVVEVLGWTVLRENGKVYAKARVTAK
jgi:hypothetical protein